VSAVFFSQIKLFVMYGILAFVNTFVFYPVCIAS